MEIKQKRLFFITGAVETLEYFSLELMDAYKKMGIQVWNWDMHAPFASRQTLEEMMRTRSYEVEDCLITFNFIGLSGEGQFAAGDRTIWDKYGIKQIIIMVDHPMYYFKQLMTQHKDWKLCCVDQGHCRFVRQFYPEYKKVLFLPLAGNVNCQKPQEKKNLLSIAERPIDILFAGNYVTLEGLLSHTKQMSEDAKAYYKMLIDQLITSPNLSLEEVILPHLREDFSDLGDAFYLETMYHMVFIDLYVRSYFRREIVCSLAEAGLNVTVIGKDWEKSGCKAMEKLHMVGQKASLDCLEYMRKSKISLNIMPWFKEGTHDRIYSSMLNGSVCLTDSSKYLDKELIFVSQKHSSKQSIGWEKSEKKDAPLAAGYSLEQRKELPNFTKELLGNQKLLQEIADQAYSFASQSHTWKQNAEVLLVALE